MAAIILLPAVCCWLMTARGSAKRALLNAYLPALLLPQYYEMRVNHLPPLTFAEAAVIPLGIALPAIARDRWRWAWMDLWVFLFALCAGVSEGMSTQLANGDWLRFFAWDFAASQQFSLNLGDGVYMIVNGILTVILPYMAGKLLIEGQSEGGVPMRKKNSGAHDRIAGDCSGC